MRNTLKPALLAFGALIGLGPLLGFVLPTAASAQGIEPEITLTPSSDWQLQEEEESCRISHEFGETTLFIRSYGPMGAYKVMIVGPGMLKDDSRARLIQAGFQENGERGMDDLFAIASKSGGLPMLSFQAVGPRPVPLFARGSFSTPDAAAGIALNPPTDELMIDGPDMQSQLLKTGNMEAPLAMLDGCEDQLLTKWGFDPETEAQLTSHPELTNGQQVGYWIIYPAQLVISHKSAIVQFRVRVDTSGRVSECDVQAPNWKPKDKRQVCRALKKGAEFKPALDADGNPVEALFRASHMMVSFD